MSNAWMPLLDLAEPDVPLFMQRDGLISRGQFAGAVEALAKRLPQQPYALNLCESRYAFSMVLCALALRGQTGLLPSSGAAGMMDQLAQAYPGAVVLSETAGATTFTVDSRGSRVSLGRLPPVDSDAAVAIAFTSGSTGQPQPQSKTWRALHHVGAVLSRRLLAGLERCSIVATVPPQHMYGLEASIMLPLAGGHCVWSGRPAFPDDVRAALLAMPAPRVLVTTPIHVRALLLSGTRLPELACLISATAPLPLEMAQQAEQIFSAPVLEVYGCSEAGTVATRRTVAGDLWQPLDGIRVETRDSLSLVHGMHLAGPVPLQDVLEIEGSDFRLLGRASDMLKVAGKRASLADLTRQLLSIPGVVDGVVFQPETGDDMLQRPAALVVAPHLSESEILGALGRLIDPVFLPRPLRKIEGLPRNTVGKLPRSTLQRLLADA